MSFVRQGSPEPIKQCQFILDDAQNIVCECGGKLGSVSHGVVQKINGDAILTIRGMQCPKCHKVIQEAKEEGEE